jgi:Spy/CpxP family protein refolding chaperone
MIRITLQRAMLGTLMLCAAITTLPAQSDAGPSQRDMGRRQRMHRGDWWNNPQTVEKLGLEEDLSQQIEEEVYQNQLTMVDLRAEMQRQNIELQNLLRAEPAPSMGDVEGQVDRFVSAQGAITKTEIMMRARIRSWLTADQRADLQRIHEARRDEMRERRRDRRPEDERPDGSRPQEPRGD